MTSLLGAVQEFGWPIVTMACLLYILLRGEVTFRYPARKSRPSSPRRRLTLTASRLQRRFAK